MFRARSFQPVVENLEDRLNPTPSIPIPPPRPRKQDDSLKDVKALTAEDVRKMGHV